MSIQTIYASGNWVNQTDATVLCGHLVGGSQTIQTLIPPSGGGTINNLKFRRTTAVAASASHTITVHKNGSATTLTCTINASGTIAQDSTHSVSFAAGDLIRVTSSTTGSPGSSDYQVTIEFTPTTEGVSIFGWGNGTNAASEFHTPLFGGTGTATESAALSEIPAACTMLGQAVNLKTAPGAGTSRIFTVRLNGVDQDGTGGTVDTRCTVSGTNTSGNSSFSLSLVAGDKITIRQTVSGSPAGTTFIQGSLSLQTALASSFFTATTQSGVFGSGDNFSYPSADSAISGTESTRQCIGGITTQYVSGMRMTCASAPGTGKSWTATVRKGGVDTGVTVTVADAQTYNTYSGASVAIAENDLLGLRISSVGTPGSTTSPERIELIMTATADVPIAVNVVGLALTGLAPLLSYTIGPNLVGLTWTGGAFVIREGKNPSPDVDGLALSGEVPDVFTTNHIGMLVGSTDLALMGQVFRVDVPHGTVNLALSGEAIAVIAPIVRSFPAMLLPD